MPVTELYKAPVSQPLLDAMGRNGYTSAWAEEQQFSEGSLVLGVSATGEPGLFLWNVHNGGVYLFRGRPA